MSLTEQDLLKAAGKHDEAIGTALRMRRLMDVPCAPQIIVDFMKQSNSGRKFKIVRGALPEVCEFVDCHYNFEDGLFYIRTVSPEFPRVYEGSVLPRMEMEVLTIEDAEDEK